MSGRAIAGKTPATRSSFDVGPYRKREATAPEAHLAARFGNAAYSSNCTSL
jgi:hypothetical protein